MEIFWKFCQKFHPMWPSIQLKKRLQAGNASFAGLFVFLTLANASWMSPSPKKKRPVSRTHANSISKQTLAQWEANEFPIFKRLEGHNRPLLPLNYTPFFREVWQGKTAEPSLLNGHPAPRYSVSPASRATARMLRWSFNRQRQGAGKAREGL